jgi:RNA polymerase II subunit A small phosphatase-like protein
MPPSQSFKLTVVLDLDETLVHATFIAPELYDFELAIPCGEHSVTVYVRTRPGVDEFIKAAFHEFDLFIFTASDLNYALPVLQKIHPSFPAERILGRAHCRLLNGFIVKDLTLFQRDLSRVILIDNSIQSFLLQPQNGLLITTWVGDREDNILMNQLLPFLKSCVTAPDVRSVLLSMV